MALGAFADLKAILFRIDSTAREQPSAIPTQVKPGVQRPIERTTAKRPVKF